MSSSIAQHYGLKCEHHSLPELDQSLNKNYKNVVLLVYDGMGSHLLQRHLGGNSFFNRHKVKDMTSVFPSTTTSATISITTAKTPVEHCWLGWDIYVKSMDKTITMFLNEIKDSNEVAADYHVARKEFPNANIVDRINESGQGNAYWISPFEYLMYDPDELDDMYRKIKGLCQKEDRKFIYVYCPVPDALMHTYGTEDERVIEMMKMLEQKTAQLMDELEDTLLIVTADHGHITAGEYIYLEHYPELYQMLLRQISLETRAVNFFIKDGFQEAFKHEFNKHFSEFFILFSKEDVLKKQLFGPGIAHEKFETCLGDFIAVAISDKCIMEKVDPQPLKGTHAGFSEDEMLIPLIILG